MQTAWRDIRLAFRLFARDPGFTIFYVSVLMLGIGATGAVFGILNSLILRELPVRQPERLVHLSGIYRNGAQVPFSFPMYEEIDRRQQVFSALLGWSGDVDLAVETRGMMFQLPVRLVTGNYYSELQAEPFLGRLILPDDVRGRDAASVAVASYECWKNRLRQDPAVVGATIRVEGRPFTIIGVTPPRFSGMTPGSSSDLTVPIGAGGLRELQSRSALWLSVGARLKDGVNREQARAQMQTVWPGILEATAPTQSTGARRQAFLSMRLQLRSAATGINTEVRSRLLRPALLLICIATVLLLIMCTNLANLTAARTAARAQEVSLRLALGSGVWTIIRGLLTESFVLAAAGSACALIVAQWGSRYLLYVIGSDAAMPIEIDLRPDWRMFAFTAAVAALVGILTSIASALQVSRQRPAEILRRSRGLSGPTARALRRTLVAAQIALSFVLLESAGLFLGTLRSLQAVQPGFSRTGLIEASLRGQPGAYASGDLSSYRHLLIDRVAALPGVRAAAFSSLPIPANGQGWRESVALVGGESNEGSGLLATLIAVSPGYFQTLGVTPSQGRDFEWSDDGRRHPVAIVDSETARLLMTRPTREGYRIGFGVQPEFQDLQVVGVVPSMALLDSREPHSLVIYVPFLQHPRFHSNGVLLVREAQPGAAGRAVTQTIASLGVEFAQALASVAELSDGALAQERAIAVLSTFAAGGALALVGIGLFGAMSYTVVQRRREIGIRMALGSPRALIRRLVLREGLVLALVGIGAGVLCWFAIRPVIAHLLTRLPPTNPVALVAVAAVVVATTMFAGYLPVSRAVRTDVSDALKCD